MLTIIVKREGKRPNGFRKYSVNLVLTVIVFVKLYILHNNFIPCADWGKCPRFYWTIKESESESNTLIQPPM